MVQQRSGVKDLFSLVGMGYDDSCLTAIRHVKSIIRAIQPRPNIRSHSLLKYILLKYIFLKHKLLIGWMDVDYA